MSQTLEVTRKNTDASGFIQGVDSFLDPLFVKDGQIVWAENAVCKGGIWQTRPGFKSRLSLCKNDESNFAEWWENAGNPPIHPQFFTIFTPTGSDPQAVFGVSGSVFTCPFNSDGTFGVVSQINGLSFDPTIQQLAWCSTVKSADIVSGLVTVVSPRNVLIIQDGASRAGYYDGVGAGHLNPQKFWKVTPDGDTLFQSGFNGTRVGLWMAWSGNRLWVESDGQVFSSDLNDPLHFTEETVLVNIPVFTFPGKITAMVDRGVSGVQQNLLFVFTATDTWTLWSGIQNRSQWITTSDFQRRVFAGVGCVAGKSPINHLGFLYWYSAYGLVSLDSLGTVTSSQFLPPIDTEVSYSKRLMSPDKTLVCSGSRDTYIFCSVPQGPTASNGRIYSNHTQVLDWATVPPPLRNGPYFSTGTPTWQGAWTGIRPIEWATATLFGQPRCFAMSMDFDNTIRIWESFQGNRCDNGGQISWTLVTKSHLVNDSVFEQSIFRHFRILFDQIYGNLDVVGMWKGLRGKYHELLTTTLTATPGSFLVNDISQTPITNTTDNESFRKQFRDIRSRDNRVPDTSCQSTNVEAPYNDGRDRAFSLMLSMKGVGAVLAYRIATDATPENTEGEVVAPETGIKELPSVNCPKYIPGSPQSFVMVDSPPCDAFSPFSPQFGVSQYVSQAKPC